MEVKKIDLDALKSKHGKVYEIKVEEKVGYFRKTTRDELKYFIDKSAKDTIGACEVVMGKCFLAGDRELLDDDEYFISAVQEFQKIFTFHTASIKKI